MSIETGPVINRKAFVELAAFSIIPIAVPGVCAVLSRAEKSQDTSTGLSGIDHSNYIDFFYSEAENIPILQQGSVETDESTFSWYNYTENKLDDDKFKSLVSYFERLSARNIKFSYDNTYDDSPAIDFTVQPNKVENHVLFIVPPEAPYSSWMPLSTGTNVIFQEDKPPITVTFIRLKSDLQNRPPHFGNEVAALNQSLVTETFNALCEVETLDSTFSIIGQEIISNSIGTLFTLKQTEFPKGTPYPKVQELLQNTNYHYFYNDKPIGILNNSAVYNSLPVTEHSILR